MLFRRKLEIVFSILSSISALSLVSHTGFNYFIMRMQAKQAADILPAFCMYGAVIILPAGSVKLTVI